MSSAAVVIGALRVKGHIRLGVLCYTIPNHSHKVDAGWRDASHPAHNFKMPSYLARIKNNYVTFNSLTTSDENS